MCEHLAEGGLKVGRIGGDATTWRLKGDGLDNGRTVFEALDSQDGIGAGDGLDVAAVDEFEGFAIEILVASEDLDFFVKDAFGIAALGLLSDETCNFFGFAADDDFH